MSSGLSLGSRFRSWRLLTIAAVLGSLAVAGVAVAEPEGQLPHISEMFVECKSPVGITDTTECVALVFDGVGKNRQTPKGTVEFTVNPQGQGRFAPGPSCGLDPISLGRAKCEVTYTPTAVGSGTHRITGHYGGIEGTETRPALEPSEDTSFLEVTPFEPHPNATTLNCQPAPVAIGHAATCDVTVRDTSIHPRTPSGVVSFEGSGEGSFSANGTCTLGAVSESRATCQVTYTPTGTSIDPRALTAKYPGDPVHADSLGNTTLPVFEEGAGGPKHATQTALGCQPSTLAAGSLSTCTVTVTDTAANPSAPSRVVVFVSDNPGNFDPGGCRLTAIAANKSSCQFVYIPAEVGSGHHTITATYEGDDTHTTSPASTDLTVEAPVGNAKDATTTFLTCVPSTVGQGKATTCTATVTDRAEVPSAPGGSIEFITNGEGSFSSPSCALGPGQEGKKASCQVTYTPATAGPHQLIASYPGDGTHVASAGSTTIAVGTAEEAKNPTQTTLRCLPDPQTTGLATTCTATVEDTAGTPSVPGGAIEVESLDSGQFPNGRSCQLGSGSEGKKASCSVSYVPLVPGLRELKATYSGDAAHRISQGLARLNVSASEEEKSPTNATLNCAPANLALGDISTCLVTVADSAAAGTMPSGSAEFDSDGPGSFGPSATCALSPVNETTASCLVTYKPTAIGSGSHRVTVSYLGDAGHRRSEAAAPIAVSERATPANPTSTTLDCLPASVALNSSATCKATVEDTSAGPTRPGGTVSFLGDGEGTFSGGGSCVLGPEGSGKASCQVTYTPTGFSIARRTLIATYSGDPTHVVSLTSTTLEVLEEGDGKDATSTALNCQPTSVILGGDSACTVVVEDTAATAAGAPTGAVDLASDGNGNLASPCALAPSGPAKASCQVVYTPAEVGSGSHRISANYQGDPGHATSNTSTQLTIAPRNGGHATAIGLSCEPTSAILGGIVICTATVDDLAANSSLPAGRIIFASDGAGSLEPGTCTPFPVDRDAVRCQVIYTPSQVGSGAHRITAVYPGDAGHEPSHATQLVNVSPPNGGHRTTTTLDCAPSPVVAGVPTTCTATVEDTDPAPSAPTRAVVFGSDSPGASSDSRCILSPAGPGRASCQVTYTPSEVGGGTHTITAGYEGDPGHEPSQGDTQVIVKAAPDTTQTTLTCQPSSVILGGGSACTAVVDDTAPSDATAPTGTVKLTSDEAGSFANPCTLASTGPAKARCQTVYVPSSVGTGTHKITAGYRGDASHAISGASTQLTIAPPNGGHGTVSVMDCAPASAILGGRVICTVTVEDRAASASAPGGDVTFASDAPGAFSPGGCTLFSIGQGKARCQAIYTPAAAGGHTISVLYSGDAAHEPSRNTQRIDVAAPSGTANTRTTVSCIPGIVGSGEASTCTATVEDLSGNPIPPVRAVFFASDSPGVFSATGCGLTSIGSSKASCQVTYTPSAVGSGSHRITASYGGDLNHEPSVAETQVNVSPAAPRHVTRTTLTCTPSTLVAGSSSTCTATIADLAAGATRPSGKVTLATSSAQGSFPGGTTCNLAGQGADEASCQLTYRPGAAGVDTIVAGYEGDGGHLASVRSTQVTVEPVPRGKDGTTTAITCQPSSVILGGGSACTVVVEDTAPTGAGAPSGTVEFASDGAGIFANACTLASTGLAKARCQTVYVPSAVGTGAHRITAGYGGDAGHEPSQATETVTVTQPSNTADTRTTLGCVPASIVVGEGSICTVTVEDLSANPVSPGRVVVFGSDNPGTFNTGGCALTPAGAGKSACQVSYTPVAAGSGTHRITAGYEGDASHEPSAAEAQVSVSAPPHQTTTAVACTPAPLLVGATSTCTATVTDSATSGATQAGGEVSFASDRAESSFPGGATCNLSGGACSVTYKPELVGSHKITASYRGDAGHATSEGSAQIAAEAVTRDQDTTDTTLTCRPSSIILGGGSACTVVVEDTAATGASAPTGAVEFTSDGDGVFANACTLASTGAAKSRCQTVYIPNALGSGSHKITAGYQGDTDHTGSADSAQLTIVAPNNGHHTTTALRCEPAGVILGGASICTVDVEDVTPSADAPSGLVVLASDGAGSFDTGGCALFAVGPGKARCQLIYTPGAAGSQQLAALYSGDAGHEPSRDFDRLTIVAPNNGHHTTTAVNCEPPTVTLGGATTCTATVTDADPAATRPTRAVIFASDGPGAFKPGGCILAASGAADAVDATCQVTYTPNALGTGTHKITAVYEGDNGHEPSQGEAQLGVKARPVPPHPTAAALVCAPAGLLVGAPATCTATVADTAAGATKPGGEVKFQSDGAGAFSGNAACTLADAGQGKATCQVTYVPSALGTGIHKVTASYKGDAGHEPSQATASLQVSAQLSAAPNTTLKKKPRKKTARPKAKFKFVADQPGSSFQCKLDKKPFKPCRSPFKKKVKPGGHTFKVRAISAQGIADPTPAVFHWKVGGQKRR